MSRIAIYPGSFDPPTLGHVAIIEAAVRLCDRLVVAVGTHAAKTPWLTVAERIALLEAITAPIERDTAVAVECRGFDGLVVDLARELGASMLVRGLRDAGDLHFEMQMAGMNAAMAPALQSIFIPATPGTRHITATLVRQIAAMGGDIGPFVPPAVAEAPRRHMAP